MNKITATTQDGRVATLTFCGCSGHRVLNNLQRPDGTTVYYYYDSSNDLIEADKPGYSSTQTLAETYEYYTGVSHQLLVVGSPRVNAGAGGLSVSFGGLEAAPGKVTGVYYHATINPSISDGTTSGLVQPSMPTGRVVWRQRDIWYPNPPSQGETEVTDTDGHDIVYDLQVYYERVRTIHYYPNATTSYYEVNNRDDNNDLTYHVDVRGNETDYVYDANHNVVAIGQPSTTTSAGTFRPTTLVSYDVNNNVTAVCDPVFSHSAGRDWNVTGAPASSDSLCPAQSGTTRYTYTIPSGGYEPFGELTSKTTPLGYATTIAYAAGAQRGADFGLPTSVTGAQFTQADGSTHQDSQQYQYDVMGDVVCANSGTGWSVMQYDSMSRLTAMGDPDDNALSGCGKTTGQFATVNYRQYFYNGALQYAETAFQHSNGTGVSYTYDEDGNPLSVTHHFGGTAGTTMNYYDGGDRLVQVVEPHDPSDFYPFPMMRRYLYDLTQGGTNSVGANSGVASYGALFAVQEYIPSSTQTGSSPSGSPQWTTVSGQSLDALNRPTAKFDLAVNPNGPVQTTAYDATSATYGLTSSGTDTLGEVTSYAYDSLNRVSATTFSGDGGVTPAEQTPHDPDRRRLQHAVGHVWYGGPYLRCGRSHDAGRRRGGRGRHVAGHDNE